MAGFVAAFAAGMATVDLDELLADLRDELEQAQTRIAAAELELRELRKELGQ